MARISIVAALLLAAGTLGSAAAEPGLVGCAGRLVDKAGDVAAASRNCPWRTVGGDVTLNCMKPTGATTILVARPRPETSDMPALMGAYSLLSPEPSGVGARPVDVRSWIEATRIECAFDVLRSAQAN